jgi:hypothetical protein
MAPVNWSQAVEKWDEGDYNTWHDVPRLLDALVERATMLREYIQCRGGNYNGSDTGHERAVKEANKTLVKVRRALGYAYPEKGAFSI